MLSEATVPEMPAGGVRRFEPAAEKPSERKRSRSPRRQAKRIPAPTGLRGPIRDVRDLPREQQKADKAAVKQASAAASSRRNPARVEASGRTKAAKAAVGSGQQVRRCRADDESLYSEDYYSESRSTSPSQLLPQRLLRREPVAATQKRKAVLCAAQARQQSPLPRSPDSRSRLHPAATFRDVRSSLPQARPPRDDHRTWQGGRYNHFDDEWNEDHWYDWEWNAEWGRGGRKGGKDAGKGGEQRRSWGGGKGGKDGREAGKGGGGAPITSRIHVSNLPRSVTEEQIWTMFQKYGEVLGVKILSPSSSNKTMSAIVRFGDTHAAKASISALHGRHELSPGGGAIEVKPAWPNRKWET